MFKLNDEKAKIAWADYKEFSDSMGKNFSLPGSAKEVELAFKMGFMYAKNSALIGQATEQAAAIDPVQENIQAPEIEAEIYNKKPAVKIAASSFNNKANIEKIPFELEQTKKRQVKIRTEKEMQVDARLVSSLLQAAKKPVKLSEIVEAVNNVGSDWYEKSASGHMLDVMRRYPVIKKVGHGLYEYQQ